MDGTDTRPSGTVLFRADSGLAIGSGHVMRCLTLARELRRRGCRVVFACAELPGHLIGRIERGGFAVRRLPAWDLTAGSADERRDATETAAVAREGDVDWLVVDHYALSIEWERLLAQCVRRILVIEDLDVRPHHCDALLDQNWYSAADDDARYAGRVGAQCRLCLGPRFALLRPEYADLRALLPPSRDPLRRVLVFFGNTDHTNETAKVLDALAAPDFASMAVDVVLGSNHPDPASVHHKAARLPAATVYSEVPTLAGFLMRADLAIGAGGTTTWERLCLELPALVTTIAANQRALTRELHEAGYLHWVGSAADLEPSDYADALGEPPGSLCDKYPLVDGYGVRRVAEVLRPSNSSTLVLRPANAADAVLFFDWRNELTVRSMSLQQGAIPWSDHQTWFRKRMASAETALYVLEADGLPVGQIRLDFNGDTAVLSYSLDALVRGRGWSKWMLQEVVRQTRHRCPAGYTAQVREKNLASRRSFVGTGWHEVSCVDGLLTYSLR